ncbi:competence type IV pilus minor pilin ComGD [Anaerobacillus sp. MEB173]|uniref:competence type IV pilus minor pilin ComGD n=1 Tax=Anaerobacillus sp. MEB173 TaxID=3383345 RepID=UPI003F92EBA4
MKQYLKNSYGYSLIEVMVVLMMITVVGGISVTSFVSMNSEKKAADFLALFESDLLYAQQYAISHGSNVTIRFDNSKQMYSIIHRFVSVSDRHFAKGIAFERGTLHLNEITFRHNGNISKSGSILINIEDNSYRVVFLLGRGRFYIEKL